MMKICGTVSNMCLSRFMVEIYGYESPRTNQGTLRRTSASGVKYYLCSVHPREEEDGAFIDRRGVDDILTPKLVQLIE